MFGVDAMWFLLSALNVNVKKFNQARVNSGSNYDSLAQPGQKPGVEQKGKSSLDFDFQYEYRPWKRGLSILLNVQHSEFEARGVRKVTTGIQVGVFVSSSTSLRVFVDESSCLRRRVFVSSSTSLRVFVDESPSWIDGNRFALDKFNSSTIFLKYDFIKSQKF
jgi:hypothetical protein